MEDAVDLIQIKLENIEKNHNNLDILIVKLILFIILKHYKCDTKLYMQTNKQEK